MRHEIQRIPDIDILIATRRARRLTQADLAKAASISVPTLRALERGQGSPFATAERNARVSHPGGKPIIQP